MMTGFLHGRISKHNSSMSIDSSSRMESFLAGRPRNPLIDCRLHLLHQEKLRAMHVASRDISPEMPHAKLGPMMLLLSHHNRIEIEKKHQRNEKVLKAENKGI